LNTLAANKFIDIASDVEIKNIWAKIASDPFLANLLLESNSDLSISLKCKKNPAECKYLYDEDGAPVNVELQVLLPQLEKLMTLKHLNGITTKKDMESIQVNDSGVVSIDKIIVQT